ncbi:MAG: metalloregulator ArsR/SmtB family transcription factor [Actinobacteria bacterium]|nr:metalloregulator ArsR/SmtB family transcription factor [Actinomycetota bacterium]
MRATPSGTEVSVAAPLGGLPEQTALLVLAKAASALADPVRLRILQLLRERGEMTVGALTQVLPVSQPRVSVHLGCLTNCGFTNVRREGRRSFYRVARPAVEDLLERLEAHAAGSVNGLLACIPCEPGESLKQDEGCC